MRIGLFSDTYLPATNGISFVLEIMRVQLELLGHEVYIFAPASNLRGIEAEDSQHIIRFPAVEGMFFDEQLTSVFFPPSALRKIRKLNLDVIHFFTPSQIGLLGAYAAIRQGIPLISQYSTDLYHYVEEYPNVLPGTIALSLAAPVILKLSPRDSVQLLKMLKPKRDITKWHKDMVARMHVMLHDHCDAVIALSRKMQKQLDGWGSKTRTTLLPTGVDPILPPSNAAVEKFSRKYNLTKNDILFLYVGRLSREKNLDLLIDAFEVAAKQNSKIKLMFVGDFDYREQLEMRASQTDVSERIVFTGRLPRQSLGTVYAAGDVFLFPSTTDTQGLVIHEAAGAGLPLVLCDADVSEVFIDNETGLLASNNKDDFAKTMLKLADDFKMRTRLGQAAQLKAAEFTELGQMQKLEKLYQKCIDEHKKLKFAGSEW